MYNIAEQVFTHTIHSGLEILVEASPDIIDRDRMDIGCGALHAAAASDKYGALCLLASIVSCIASLLQYCLLASTVSCIAYHASLLQYSIPCLLASMVCCM